MGVLIAIDGLDGSGKNTQSHILLKRLLDEGKRAKLISFPDYGKPCCKPVEEYLNGSFGDDPDNVNCYAASTFFAIDRYASYKLDWGNEYRDGTIIIANRYTTANAIHQLTKLKVDERDGFLEWLWDYEFQKLGIPAPDMTVFLDVPVEISLSLIEKRGEAKDIHENASHLTRAREAALYASEKCGWKHIECSFDGKILPPETIAEKIYTAVSEII